MHEKLKLSLKNRMFKMQQKEPQLQQFLEPLQKRIHGSNAYASIEAIEENRGYHALACIYVCIYASVHL